MTRKLDLLDASDVCNTLLDWTPHPKAPQAISRTFQFSSFVEAFAVMSAVALEAEKLGHHPEWSNVYNRLDIRLTTHDAQGVTELDVTLANKIDALARKFSA